MNKDKGKIAERLGEYGTKVFECLSVGFVGLTLVKMVKYFTKERE